MKVLHVYKTYYPDSIGGVETVINKVVCGVQNLGIQSEVLTTGNGNDVTIVDGHKVHRCKNDVEIASTPFSISAIFKLRKLVKNVDIIHYHAPYPYADLLHFLAAARKPSLVTYHSDIVKQKNLLRLYSPLRSLFLNSVDIIVATSPNYFSSSDVLQRFKHKTTVLPLGLDDSAKSPSSPDATNKWKSQLPSRFFLFLGVLRYYKGVHTLIEAARRCNYPVVIAGAGPEESRLKSLVKKYQLNNVIFLGKVSEEDKQALLRLCYAFVFPSHLRSEAYGLSLLEGAIYGKPLICCEIGSGMTYINIDKETGFAVPPDDPEQFFLAMKTLWESPELANQLGTAARKRYEALFTTEQMASAYAKLYHELAPKA